MRIFRIIFLTALFILPAHVLTSGQNIDELKRFKKGVELLENKHYHQAIEIFNSLHSIEALREDCDYNIRKAKEMIAYIIVKSNDEIINQDEPIDIGCNQYDTVFTVLSNYKLKIDDYTTGIREAKIKGNKLYISFIEANKSIEDKFEKVKVSAGHAPNKCERTIELVHQKHPAYLDCSSKTVNSPADGDLASITVTANVGWEVLESQTNWFDVVCDSNKITIKTVANNQVTDRNAKIIVRAKSDYDLNITINVNQRAGAEELILSKSDLYMPADGTKVEYVKVYSNDIWQVKDHPGWCRVEKVPGTDSLKIECTKNVSGVIRDEYAKIVTRSGNKVVSVRIVQPSDKFVPQYAFEKILEGRNVSLGVHASGILPTMLYSSSGEFAGSMVNYGLGSNYEKASYHMDLGFSVGVVADIRLYKNLYLKTGVDYTRFSYSNEFKGNVNIMMTHKMNVSYLKGNSLNSYKESYTFNMIEIPILASYRFVLNRNSCIHLDFGPYINYGVSAEMDLSGTTDSETLFEYKIINGSYTNEKVSEIRYSSHFNKVASIDLYDKKSEMKTIYTYGTDVSVPEKVVFEEAPFRRLNVGLSLGISYEYAGFCVGMNYRQGLTNIANEKFWESDRLILLNTANVRDCNISGYKQRIGYLSLSLSYLFRY